MQIETERCVKLCEVAFWHSLQACHFEPVQFRLERTVLPPAYLHMPLGSLRFSKLCAEFSDYTTFVLTFDYKLKLSSVGKGAHINWPKQSLAMKSCCHYLRTEEKTDEQLGNLNTGGTDDV